MAINSLYKLIQFVQGIFPNLVSSCERKHDYEGTRAHVIVVSEFDYGSRSAVKHHRNACTLFI